MGMSAMMHRVILFTTVLSGITLSGAPAQNDAASRAQDSRELFRVVTLHQLRHKRDVAARAEPSPRACDDHDADIAIAAGMLERFGQVATHVTDERVQALRTIQCDRHDAFSFRNLNMLVHIPSWGVIAPQLKPASVP